MTRDDEFANLAAEYAAADRDTLDAERRAAQAATEAANARAVRERLKKKLAAFVGANVRTRNAVVGGDRLVRAECRSYPGGESVEVTVEDVTLTRGAG